MVKNKGITQKQIKLKGEITSEPIIYLYYTRVQIYNECCYLL